MVVLKHIINYTIIYFQRGRKLLTLYMPKQYFFVFVNDIK